MLHLIDSLALGGTEQSLVTLAPALLEHGVDLHVATFADRSELALALRDIGVPVTVGLGSERRAAAHAATAHVRTVRPDLIHTSLFEATLAGVVAGRRAGVPVLTSLVSTEFGRTHYRAPGLRRHRVAGAHAAAVAAARRVTGFHAVSHHVRDTMARRLLIPGRKITVIPRGRDPLTLGRRSDDRRHATRARLGHDDRPLVLAVARHDHAKGLDLAVEAVSLLSSAVPGVRLLVAGPDGPATAELHDLVERLDAPVEFLGRRDDVADLMCAADALCFPSRREGMPGALLEAMAMELPIVAAHLPVATEVLGADHPVTDHEPATIAGALEEVLAGHHPDMAGLRARFEQRFTVAATAAATVTWYRSHAGIPA
ncbi:MAG: glycosyltransferase family 4 protein [Actinomycetota bacterium]